MTQKQQESQQQHQQTEQHKSKKDELGNNNNNNTSILRRNNRGCKSKEFYNWPEQPFDDMDSPLAVQQYIQQLIHRDPSNIDEILELPEGQELGAWKIEHLRLFCMQLNKLATKLQEVCQPETCNQMTATEQWIFLCAAHKQPNECPAIDYTRHTLDGAASLLNSNKYFPSRVTIKESSVAKLGSICRRVYRIFSHAYYHHFQVFDEFEKETHLCRRFSKFVTMYQLMSKETLIVPPDGSKPEVETQKQQATSDTSTIVKDTPDQTLSQQQDPSETIRSDDGGSGSQVKNETGSKKQQPTGDSMKNSSSSSAGGWAVSQGSNTNTIVKGLSTNVLISNSTKGSIENNASTPSESDSIPATNTPATTSTTTNSASNMPQLNSKTGVESEA